MRTTSSTTRTVITSPPARRSARASPGSRPSHRLRARWFGDIDLRDRYRILHEVPLQQWSTLYAAPDDSGEVAGTQILVYEADVTPLS